MRSTALGAAAPGVPSQRHLRDARDHVLRIVERIDAFRALLQNALTVNATLVGQRQNDEIKRLTQTSLDQNDDVKRISAWAAILFAPTLVGTIYGMNFKHMPELGWRDWVTRSRSSRWLPSESCSTSSSSAAAGSNWPATSSGNRGHTLSHPWVELLPDHRPQRLASAQSSPAVWSALRPPDNVW